MGKGWFYTVLVLVLATVCVTHSYRGFERDTIELDSYNPVKFVNGNGEPVILHSIETFIVKNPFPIRLNLDLGNNQLFKYISNFKKGVFYGPECEPENNFSGCHPPLDPPPIDTVYPDPINIKIMDSLTVFSASFYSQVWLLNYVPSQLSERELIRKFVFRFMIEDISPDTIWFSDTLYLTSDVRWEYFSTGTGIAQRPFKNVQKPVGEWDLLGRIRNKNHEPYTIRFDESSWGKGPN